MRILDSIVNAIKFGVQLLCHVEEEGKQIVRQVVVDLAIVGAKIETKLYGPLPPEKVDALLAMAQLSVPDAVDWRHSIVDLMKVLHLDSSLSARSELARELGYSGKLNGSEEMNIWLHDKVMDQVAHRLVIGPAEPSDA
jgi:hypothetical protein